MHKRKRKKAGMVLCKMTLRKAYLQYISAGFAIVLHEDHAIIKISDSVESHEIRSE